MHDTDYHKERLKVIFKVSQNSETRKIVSYRKTNCVLRISVPIVTVGIFSFVHISN